MTPDSAATDSLGPRLYAALRELFGYDEFRPHQEDIVRALVAGRDAFVVMPTGGGKSLCYQLPARLRDGTALVVSPLISLMKDQVDAANANGFTAAFLNSTQEASERSEVVRALRAGQLDLLYVSPERFALEGFSDFLRTCKLSMVAIDEAHCISEWGHDFRPDYLALGQLTRIFPDCPSPPSRPPPRCVCRRTSSPASVCANRCWCAHPSTGPTCSIGWWPSTA
jgi:ATP-dependent DNA helicase RecQ